MTYVEIDMPNAEDKTWFMKRREKYYVDRNIHHYPQLEQRHAWRVEKSRGVAALVPSSLAHKRISEAQDIGKCKADNLAEWYATNVKSKLVSLKRRQRLKKKNAGFSYPVEK